MYIYEGKRENNDGEAIYVTNEVKRNRKVGKEWTQKKTKEE